MATVTLQVCDLCGDGETRSVATVPFEAMGSQYDVDVCETHQAELTELQEGLQRYAEAGRLHQGPKKPRRSRSQDGSDDAQPERPARQRRTSPEREENKELRDWARQQGIDIGDRGRISEELRDRYRRWRWDQDHPVRPVPSPPPSQPRYVTPPPVPPTIGGGRRLDPESALAVHSEGNAYRR